ncbi:hypothetical protein D9M72_621320 [compost metagenome]
MLFEAELDPGHQPFETGGEPGFEIAMTAPFDTDGFQAGIEGQEMRLRGQSGAPE